MTTEAQTIREHGEVHLTATAAILSGEVRQLPDGRAGVRMGLKAAASGDVVAFATSGVFKFTKSTSVAFLPGQQVWWDPTNNVATYRLAAMANDGFFLGVCCEADTVAAATTQVMVDLNRHTVYNIEQGKDEWDHEATDGLGVTIRGGAAILEFDAVAEVAQAALHSIKTFDVDTPWIWEAEVDFAAEGNNAALDIDLGVASGSHATDFEAITAFAAFHLDGSALDLKTHSDDGTTDVAPDDTDVNVVNGTKVFLQIDGRDKTALKFYVNGARVNSAAAFVLTAYTSTLLVIAHMEKTSDDTVGKTIVQNMRQYFSHAA